MFDKEIQFTGEEVFFPIFPIEKCQIGFSLHRPTRTSAFVPFLVAVAQRSLFLLFSRHPRGFLAAFSFRDIWFTFIRRKSKTRFFF